MKMRKIRRCMGVVLLVVLSSLPCLAFGFSVTITPFDLPGEAKQIKEIKRNISEIKNPDWKKTDIEVSGNAYLYRKYIYFEGKYYDVKIVGVVEVPEKMILDAPQKKGGYVSDTISILESDTGDLAQLKNIYFCICDVDSTEKLTFQGDISGNLYKKRNSTNYTTSSFDGENTYLSASNFTDTIQDHAIKDETHYSYIKSDFSDKNEISFKLESNLYLLDDIMIKFYKENDGSEVTYKTDGKGQIIGISSEAVDINQNPTGGYNFEANEGQQFKYWICDKTVTLSNGNVIVSGDSISKDQLMKVAVKEDLTFTACFEAIPVVSAEASAEPSSETSAQATSETSAQASAEATAEASAEPSDETSAASALEISANASSDATANAGATTNHTFGSATESEITPASGLASDNNSVSNLDNTSINNSDNNSEYDLGNDSESAYESDSNGNSFNFVKTGDNKNIALYSFVLIVSAILLRIVRKAM